jgi:anion-transporting  ArsA/GET3 family ATPase
MEEGFRQRATAVLDLLADPSSSFVLITSPRRDAVDEATFFAERLAESKIPVEALVVNRVHPRFGDGRPEGLRARASTLAAKGANRAAGSPDGDAARRLAALYENLADFCDVADLERHHVDGVADRVGHATIAYVPYLARDVYDFDALGEVGRYLFDGAVEAASNVVAR